MLRPVLLIGAVCTYFIDPDDVVWRFVKNSPHARMLEHLCFATAAAALCISLALEVRATLDVQRSGDESFALGTLRHFLQAVGIGALVPLSGFLLLVCGDLVASLLPVLFSRHLGESAGPHTQNPLKAEEVAADTKSDMTWSAGWRTSLYWNIGLLCACVSMIVFSIVLIDRVADVLFGITAMVSLVALMQRGKLPVSRA